MLIDSIYKDHGYINRIIQLLDKKLNRLEEEKTVNYNVIRESVDYLSSFAEKNHHPKEDRIYQYFIDKYGENKALTNLLYEHNTLSADTVDFSITLEMILQDAIVPKDIFREHLLAFTQRIRRHLELEEKEVFPFLKAQLTEIDWRNLEKGWVEEDDPVFGERVHKRYVQLAEQVRV